jgi:hypothetical protein
MYKYEILLKFCVMSCVLIRRVLVVFLIMNHQCMVMNHLKFIILLCTRFG